MQEKLCFIIEIHFAAFFRPIYLVFWLQNLPTARRALYFTPQNPIQIISARCNIEVTVVYTSFFIRVHWAWKMENELFLSRLLIVFKDITLKGEFWPTKFLIGWLKAVERLILKKSIIWKRFKELYGRHRKYLKHFCTMIIFR